MIILYIYLINYHGLETLTSAYFDSFRTVSKVNDLNDIVHYYTRMLYYTIIERSIHQDEDVLIVYGHEQTLSMLNIIIKSKSGKMDAYNDNGDI